MLLCLALSALLPGLCAAAEPHDTPGSAAAHHGAHNAATPHAGHAPHAAPLEGTHPSHAAPSGHRHHNGQGHHEQCPLMVRCQWAAAPATAPAGALAPLATQCFLVAAAAHPLPAPCNVDTPPPRPRS
jgi:hypothetical protein